MLTASRLPIRVRLTLWYTGFLAALVVLFSVSVYVLLGHSLVDNLDANLHQRINQLMPLVEVNNNRPHLTSLSEEPDSPYIPVSLLAPSGRSVGPPPPAPIRSWILAHPTGLGAGFQVGSSGPLRVAAAPVENNGRVVGHLVVWESLNAINQARRSLLLLLLGVGPALLALAGLGGMVLARRALMPVAAITQTAAGISASDLQRRVPVGPAADELGHLASTFNAMIERLAGAVDRERRFTADASHELRAPLSVILAEASLALEQPQDLDGYRSTLQTIYEEAAGMREMVADLLTLARTETIAGMTSSSGLFETVRIDSVVKRAIKNCNLAAHRHDVRITVDAATDQFVSGSTTLLARALRNLLDNAVKASPPNGTVRVGCRRAGPFVTIDVEDEGSGIEPHDLERIFEPFYQVGKARTPGDSHGLGLAICRKIVEAHGGTVRAGSPGSGACFHIRLPPANPESSPEGTDPAWGLRI